MKRMSFMAGLLATTLLAGCNIVPEMTGADSPPEADQCLSDVPSLTASDCMLSAWVDFGLAAQRADREWREHILEQVEGDTKNERLARAVVYSWSSQNQWEEAAELFKADLAAAPSDLQPLLRQWLNGLEARRKLMRDLYSSEASRRQVISERDELAEKLDALTAIEESINSRNQTP
ncbi:hypothetical protein SAMN02745148_00768 [Modicisalibacter ilicicola DSM 19980]|uniref:YfhG lipoprotein n=1 Tax=Modicisalibacter ilicicola DSM 19980 TaxID=1121942 RepID=A0A1M4UV18_9GAMM|nr:hypothetical protein [Halomonas ilicicola]SHE60611.1 hypothetical protein SAMN02745148_00768 [Halomonas ilicicola DSM 19980]